MQNELEWGVRRSAGVTDEPELTSTRWGEVREVKGRTTLRRAELLGR